MTNGIINGTDFVFYIDDVAVAYVTTGSLSYTHSPREHPNKTDGKSTQRGPGRTDWNCSVGGWVAFADKDGVAILGADDLLQLVIDRSECTIRFSTGVSGDKEWEGDGYLNNFALDFPDQESSTFQLDISANGDLAPATVS